MCSKNRAVGTMIVKPWPMYVASGKFGDRRQSESRARLPGLMLEGAIDFCTSMRAGAAAPTEWPSGCRARQRLWRDDGSPREPQVSAHLLASIPHSACLEVFHPTVTRCSIFSSRTAIRSRMDSTKSRRTRLGLQLDESVIKKTCRAGVSSLC